MILTIILFYLGWGLIWSAYALFSTIFHPAFDKDKLPPFKLFLGYLQTATAWPYFMYRALATMKKEAERYKKNVRRN